jgi:hypothetical protein
MLGMRGDAFKSSGVQVDLNICCVGLVMSVIKTWGCNFNFFKGLKMNYLKVWTGIVFASLLTACTIGNGRICGPSTPIAYCDHDAYQRLAYPKAYGKFWAKPGMTTESWRQDWVECGGKSNGNYSSESPIGADTAALLADSKRVGDRLGTCMQSKRYVYQNS